MNEHPPYEHAELHIGLSKTEAAEMLMLMNRALNVLEPIYWPKWADGLVKRLQEFSGAQPVPDPVVRKEPQ